MSRHKLIMPLSPLAVTRLNGSSLLLQRRSSPINIMRAEQTRKLFEEDYIALTVESVAPIPFTIGDKLIQFGEEYTLNQLPAVDKTSSRKFSYDLRMEGPQYALRSLLFFNLDAGGVSTGMTFSLTGTLELFAGVLINNIRRAFPTWSLGEVKAGNVQIGAKTLQFSGENCLAVLQRLCKDFETEFEIIRAGDGKRTLHLRQIGTLLPMKFAYGQGGGLYTLSRQNVSDSDFITRLYAFGANKNLPAGYRAYAGSLRLATDGGYIEKADAKAAFGLIEGAQTWEDIFPKRVGTITAVGTDVLTFSDAGMDFDLMAESGPAVKGKKQYKYLQSGTSAKVSVLTGSLAGYGFEVVSYNHATKTFVVNAFTNDSQLTLPGVAPFQFAKGDTYVLVDIIMPDSYVTEAEALLKNTAETYLAANSAPRVQYALNVYEGYLRKRGAAESTTNVFSLGDIVQVIDADLAIDQASRVLGFTRDLLNPYRYELTIADSYEVSVVDGIRLAQQELKTIISINDPRNSDRARYGWRAEMELLSKVFDPDGSFDGTRLKPLSVQTSMLAVGAKADQLILDLVIEPNYQGQPNTVRAGQGTLIHYTIEETIRTWRLSPTTTTIDDNDARYIYARCHRSNYNDAAILFSTQQIRVDDSATYYHFTLGMLHSVDTTLNVRFINLTFGFTAINGRFIRTGRIQSADGQTYFDLDSGEIGGRIIFNGGGNDDGQDVAVLEAEVEYIRSFTIPNLRRNLSGRIVSYFQEIDPNTWPESLRSQHDGDVWYKPSSKRLYVYSASNNSWTETTDKTAVAAYEKASQAKDTADGKRRSFIVQPFTPYDAGDLWSDGDQLRRAKRGRDVAEPFDINDWERAVSYDNTKTTIEGGLITSGTIQLGGDGGSVVAGITGSGTVSTSVRIWAGNAYANRLTAPFRVLQSGEVFVRRRLELENELGEGQAGVCGAVSPGDGLTRFWAGKNYANRGTAPFQVDATGKVIMTVGEIGKLKLVDGGLIADDGKGTSVQIDINRPDDSQGSYLTNLRSTSKGGANTIQNTALYLEATGDYDVPGSQVRDAYSLYAKAGKALMNQALINGRAYKYVYANSGTRTVSFQAARYDVLFLNPASGRINITIDNTDLYPGAEKMLVNLNNNNSDCYVTGGQILDGVSDVRISGGEVVKIILCVGGYWLATGRFDNNFPQSLTLPTQDAPLYQ